mmetsp:Transcript_16742/g.23656  ORF Transcript_16742/g.23656 Transcript_16742/m.23656 type:complete len:457 (+) Transcript_16742:103-1473(+)|eukprot:CAMPEP_0201707214 /NCGR_PEP_ID=MMETSP0578-20130828/51075_1 /ASSEMBLY_ACC=CAM_ASM_000663 /TAXON_ID=267565 /ORGANISM="Skeletonema grethea, Strain CCMP 1804" /LENGTH=456 /DNA_ID=CAMNT_0048195789 /DNA_START=98 /DNA_END=1468 /DNA_ORIENTATION=-
MVKASLLLRACLLIASSYASSFSKPNPNSKLRLQQVLVVHRHGDRSPITPLKDEDFWQTQLPQSHVLEGIAKGTTLIRPPEGNPKHGAHGRGPFGQLTMMGVLQMASLGERLREEFTGTLFTDEKPLHPNRIRIMSTDFPRTIQSVQALLTGLFEGAQLENDGLPAIEIDVRRTNSYLIPDPQPRQYPTQLVLESHLAKRPHLVEKEKELNELAHRVTDALQEHLGDGAMGVSFGIGEEKSQDDVKKKQKRPLAWAQLAEILICLHSRDLLPPTLSKEDVEEVNKHVAWRWFENLSHPVLAKSAMWKFANKLVEDMEQKVACVQKRTECIEEEECDIEEPLLCIYSAHDSTLIGLLCVLQLEQPETWPEYGSYLKAELIQEDVDGKSVQHWVRFSLNGQILRSTWMRDDESNEPVEMVPLSKLSEMIHDEHDIYCEQTGTKLFTWKNGALVHTTSQ